MKTEQVIFYDYTDNETHGGILVDDKYVICGCCGGVFDLDEGEIEIASKLSWVNISEEIKGE